MRVCRGCDDVGSAECLLPGRDGLCAELVGERFRFRVIARGDPNFVDRTHAFDRLDVGSRLHARAEHGEDRCLLAREQARRERGTGCRSRRRDVRAVHQRDRCAVLMVEHENRGLMRGTVDVAREERHELARERRLRHVRRHHAEQALLLFDERRDASRHRDVAVRKGSMRVGDRVDESVEVEQLSHLRLGEDEHQEIFFSNRSACWFHGTRCVTPAADTRPRFARYQS